MSNKITAEEVKKTADLARINLSIKEQEKFAQELGAILDFFKDIEEIKTDDAEKFDHYQLDSNQLRADEVLEKLDGLAFGIKENFPDKENDYLKVKTVIKK